jgi:hypothetical protein
MWYSIIAIAVIIVLPYLNIIPKFSISGEDIPTQEVGVANQNTSIEIFEMITADSGLIRFLYLNNSYEYPDGKMLYLLDNFTTLYGNIPELSEGEHTLIKYQLVIRSEDIGGENITRIAVSKGIKTFYHSVRNQNVTVQVPGPIQYLNNTIYVNRTINNTITEQVQIEPTIFQKYGIAGIVFVIMGLVIIYLIYKRTR